MKTNSESEKLLRDAIFLDSIDLVRSALNLEPNLDWENADELNPLEYAISLNHIRIIQHLSEIPNVPPPRIALTGALLRNSACVSGLLKLGARFKYEIFKFAFEGKLTPLQETNNSLLLFAHDNGCNALFYAAAGGDLPTVEWLTTIFKDHHAMKDAQGYTPIDYAAWNGHLSIVQFLFKLLIPSPPSPPLVNTNYFVNTLLCAAENGHLATVIWLINSNNLSYTAESLHGRTLIETVIRSGQVEIAKWLVKEKQLSFAGCKGLPEAAANDHLSMVKWLVTEQHFPLNQTNKDGYTALLTASEKGHINEMIWLLRMGANINKMKNGKWKPLDLTATHKSTEAPILLASRGAELFRMKDDTIKKATDGIRTRIAEIQKNHGLRFEQNLAQVCDNKLLIVDVAGDWLSSEQIKNLIKAVKNSSVVQECYFGSQILKTSAKHRAYIKARFIDLPNAHEALANNNVYQLLDLIHQNSDIRKVLRYSVLDVAVQLTKKSSNRNFLIPLIQAENNKSNSKLELNSLESGITNHCETGRTDQDTLWQIWNCINTIAPNLKCHRTETFRKFSPFKIPVDISLNKRKTLLIEKKNALRELLNTLSERGTPLSLIVEVEKLIEHFDAAISSLKTNTTNQFTTMIMGLNFGPYFLKIPQLKAASPTISACPLLQDTELGNSNAVQFREAPDHLDKTLLLNCLAKVLLFSQTSMPFQPVKIVTAEGESRIYSVSPLSTIPDLPTLLEKFRECHATISSENFAEATILELVCYKLKIPINFKCDVTSDSDMRPSIIKLNSLSPSAAKDSYQTLYFFPQMQQKIAESYLSKLSKTSPEIILLSWLQQLELQNQIFAVLIAQGKFSESECAKLGLPICISPAIIESLYKQLSGIFSLVKNSKNLTLQDLYRELEPDLTIKYDQQRNNITSSSETILTQKNSISSLSFQSEPTQSLAAHFIFLLHIVDCKITKNYLSNNLFQMLHTTNQIFSPHRGLLFTAVINNCLRLTEAILQTQIYDLNKVDFEGYTLLHHAIMQNSPKLVALLLQAGADRTIPDSRGETALVKAKNLGHHTIVNQLQSPKIELNKVKWSFLPRPKVNQDLSSPTSSSRIYCSRTK